MTTPGGDDELVGTKIGDEFNQERYSVMEKKSVGRYFQIYLVFDTAEDKVKVVAFPITYALNKSPGFAIECLMQMLLCDVTFLL
jgi:hypothetical protein